MGSKRGLEWVVGDENDHVYEPLIFNPTIYEGIRADR